MNDLAIRPPRLTALGLKWTEDFRRGVLGVEKNQGVINGAVEIDGRWARFTEQSSKHIDYPPLIIDGVTQFTIGCWIRDYETTVFNANFFGHSKDQFSEEMTIGATGAGALRARVNSNNVTDTSGINLAGEHLVVFQNHVAVAAKFYIDGEEVSSHSGEAAISLISGSKLVVGSTGGGQWPMKGRVADPFIILNTLTADEHRELYARSLYH
jgi:hypothetical protein